MKLYPIVILAGGLAQRLRPLTSNLPKSMIVIDGKPFIQHQLELLKKNGFENVELCLGFLGELTMDFIIKNNNFGLNVHYSFDGKELLGTGGCISKILPYLEDKFFTIYGDSYLLTDYKKIQQKFIEKNKLALMTVYKNEDKYDKSNVEYENGEIVNYDKVNKTDKMSHIDFGTGIFSKKAFTGFSGKFDLYDVYRKMQQEKQLSAYVSTSRFYEVGSFRGIRELENYFIRSNNV